MVLGILNQKNNVDLFQVTADLKKYVSIYTRKQVRQKREGFGACKF